MEVLTTSTAVDHLQWNEWMWSEAQILSELHQTRKQNGILIF